MFVKRCVAIIVCLAIVGAFVVAEDYTDYDEAILDKWLLKSIPEVYRLVLQRHMLESRFRGVPLGHLMIRKSQRSPSLRLRFGRSNSHLPVAVSPMAVGAVTGFEENN